MSALDLVHGRVVHSRRVRVLAERIARLVPEGASVLDVGCGDGLLARLVGERRPDLDIRGIDTLVREGTHIPVEEFDGTHLPFGDGAFDVVLFVDVLHHTVDPRVLLAEARRVARTTVVIKDHLESGPISRATLRFMDWVGNARHGVVLPYNYWPRQRWDEAFRALGLTVADWNQRLRLYPIPADWIFGGGLHFVARLAVHGSDGVGQHAR